MFSPALEQVLQIYEPIKQENIKNLLMLIRVEFNKNGNVYKIYGFKGNATVSSNIQLYRNEVMLGVSNTVDFYNQGEIIMRNDSTLSLFLSNKKDKLRDTDTVRIKFIEPACIEILN